MIQVRLLIWCGEIVPSKLYQGDAHGILEQSDSNLLPLVKSCDILKQYCRFIEIVEQNYDKRHPKKSFQKAIDQAIEEGILVDYLDRKSRAVRNMLCAKYDYKTDIAVKKEEAFQDGMEAGISQKAVEDATNMIKKKYPVADISEITGLTVEQVLALQEKKLR